MQLRLGSFRGQSRPRKALNILGFLFACVVFLELFLRGLGFLMETYISHPAKVAPASPHTAYTIVCIGDSWTMGDVLGNYPGYLQEELQTLAPDSPFQVINLGRAGLNSSQGLRILADSIEKYQPDMVIVMIGNNDHWNLSERAYWQFSDRKLTTLSLWGAKMRVFFHSLRVYKLCNILSAQLTGTPLPNQFYYFAPEQQSTTAEQLAAIDRPIHQKQLEYNLLKFIELSEISDFALIFQTYFHFHGYHVNEIIRDVATTNHVPLVDNNILFHEKIAVADREKYLIPDGHPNPLGYQFITGNIIAVLRASGMIPSLESSE